MIGIHRFAPRSGIARPARSGGDVAAPAVDATGRSRPAGVGLQGPPRRPRRCPLLGPAARAGRRRRTDRSTTRSARADVMIRRMLATWFARELGHRCRSCAADDPLVNLIGTDRRWRDQPGAGAPGGAGRGDLPAPRRMRGGGRSRTCAIGVAVPVVNTSHTGNHTARVVQHRLDDVRLDADLSRRRSGGECGAGRARGRGATWTGCPAASVAMPRPMMRVQPGPSAFESPGIQVGRPSVVESTQPPAAARGTARPAVSRPGHPGGEGRVRAAFFVPRARRAPISPFDHLVVGHDLVDLFTEPGRRSRSSIRVDRAEGRPDDALVAFDRSRHLRVGWHAVSR